MVNSDVTLTELSNLISRLHKEREELSQKFTEIDEQVKAVEVTMRLIRHNGAQTTPDIHDAIVAELRKAKAQKKTQMDALMLIAGRNNGQLKPKEAKKIMVEAGLIKTPKNAASIVYALIARSEKFERIASGEYRLIGSQQSLPSVR